MKLSEFIVLDEVNKKQALLHTGVLIGKRREEDRLVFLFKMEDYYVESVCSFQTKDVEQFRVFQNEKLLMPYLEEIQIEDLLD